ncbi:MAG: hypothetical protein WC221_09540 [Candidatus Riflebacteria bacterium]
MQIKNITQIFFLSLTLCALSFLGPGSPAQAQQITDNEISMYTMNTQTAAKRISDGYFSVLYRGFGSRKADKIDKEELLGFHFLTDTICNSHGMRRLISKLRKEGNNESEAFKKAKNLHARTLIDIFDTIESSKELYLNEKNKDKNTKDKNLLIAESHFIFTSPNIGVARFYGPIVMVIEEKGSPRGMDLNSIAKDSKYYSAARFLKNISKLGFKQIIADYIGDKDEYVIPSYITPRDVSGLIVHAPSPVVIGGKIAFPPPAIKRIYRKYTYNGATVIDVVDKNDALIARLSASPSASVVSPTTKRSNEKLPDCIQKAWNDYIARLRRKQ